jgi:structure-specific recognition protein 1
MTSREAFNDIYLNLSRKPGATRFSESGFGWKPANGETYTCDQSQIMQAQWSRAARGYEIKILSRNDGVIQLDGFKQEVNAQRWQMRSYILTATGLRSRSEALQGLVRYQPGQPGTRPSWMELGQS